MSVLVYGDAGHEPEKQMPAVSGIKKSGIQFDFALNTGDNFYRRGVVKGIADEMWVSRFEKTFGSLGFPIFSVLGNHDGYNYPYAQVAYSGLKPGSAWKMPNLAYDFAIGDGQFFAINTANLLGDDQPGVTDEELSRLDAKLSSSKAKWKFVFGHHAPLTSGGHKNDDWGHSDNMRKRLLGILDRNQVTLYISGHEHNVEYIDGKVNDLATTSFLISGAASDHRAEPKVRHQGSLFFLAKDNGFAHLKISKENVVIEILNSQGKVLFSQKL